MPKHQKDAKLEVWKNRPARYDNIGAHHGTGSYKAGEVWASIWGTDYTEYYAMHAKWAEPTFSATVTRPSWTIEVGDHIRTGGKAYKVVSVDDLSGKVGRDMRLACQYDSRFVIDNT